MWLLISVVLAFLIGSIPFGYLIARGKGIDIREHGSGNIGATNVLRVLGKKVGIPVFILDMLKGWLPVWLAQHWAGGALAPVLAAFAAVMGHSFTPWLGFKGGKGVATTAGGLLALMPWTFLIVLVIWLVVFYTTRYVALASIVAGVALPITLATLMTGGFWNWPLFVLTLALAVLVVVRHRGNMQRLLAGTEHRFGKQPSLQTSSKGEINP